MSRDSPEIKPARVAVRDERPEYATVMPRSGCKAIAIAAMLCLSLLYLSLRAVARAAEFTVLTHPLPPFTTGTAAAPTGFAVEVVEAILRRTGDTGEVQVVPYPRLMRDVRQGPSTIAFIVARTPEREALMQWIGPIVVTPVSLYMKAGAPVVPRTLADARALGSIGVTRGGIDARFFEEHSFGNLDFSESQPTDLRKVYLGRLDATPMGAVVFDSVLDQIGLRRSDFQRAPFTLYDSSVYAAVSPDVPGSVIQSWSAALDAMKRSGEYAAILTRYGIEASGRAAGSQTIGDR
jgi:polar amino acid transport system substrate-binding protein